MSGSAGSGGGDGRRDIYLLRHGRTPLNAEAKLRGWIDTPLDPVGRLEAEALGELFASVPLGAIVSSPLSRAVDTAAAVAARHRHLRVKLDADLRDRDWGPWAGHAEAEVIQQFGRLDDAPGVEDPEAFRGRVVAALERLAQRAGSRPFVAVAHDAVNRRVITSLVPRFAAKAGIDQHTGCWNHIVYAQHHWGAPVINAVPGDGQRP